ncbi:MAG: helix-turn-helix domain-containing protein [Chitinophagales bacterium]|nr:helix-turn-helix domain-containing protein [Chitinophagales bacterium]
MNLKPIKTKRDYNEALQRMEELWGAKSGTPQGNELDILATLIDKYEEEQFPIEAPDAVEALKYLMEEKGIDRKELSKAIGDKSKVSEILSRKRELSKRMIKALHETFGIPYEVLMA